MGKKVGVLLMVMLLLTGTLYGCGQKQQGAVTDAGKGETVEKSAGEEAGSAEEKKEIVKVRVASLPLQISASIYYMHKVGWDVENGFDVDLSTYASGAPVNEALGAKLWDMAAIGGAGVMSLCKYDAVQIFAHVDSGPGIDAVVRSDSPILKTKGYNADYPDVYGDPESIKGCTILLPMGSGSHLQIVNWLSLFGLDEKDVSLVHMEYPAAYQAFTSGEGDITTTAYPYTKKYHNEGYISASSLTAQKIPYYDNIVVAREFYEEPANREIMVAFLQQLMRVADAFRADEQLYVDTVMEWYKLNGNEVDEETTREEILQKPFVTTEEAKSFDTTASLKLQAEFMYSVGNITEEELQKVEQNITTEVIDEALGR